MLVVRGVLVDLIEVLTYHILVEEVETGAIYLVPLSDVEMPTPESDELVSNIVSLEEWKQCQDEKRNSRTSYQRRSISKLPKPQPEIRLVR